MASFKGSISAQDVEFSPSVLELMKKLERNNNGGATAPLKDASKVQQVERSSKNSPRDPANQTFTGSPTAKEARHCLQSPDVISLSYDDNSEVVATNEIGLKETPPSIVGSIKVDESFQKEQSIRCTPMNPWYLSNGLPSFAKKSSKRTFLEFIEPLNETVHGSSSAAPILASATESSGKKSDKVIRETSILTNAIKSESKKNQEFMNFLENIITEM